MITNWIPALDGVEHKLRVGAKRSTWAAAMRVHHLLAQAYPDSTFVGYDAHDESIEIARQRAEQAGVKGGVTFEAATAKNYPETYYDLICFMDYLHDMGDPVGAATPRYRRSTRMTQRS